ncbi:UNVERIFIED_ORG: hypothetical protein BDU10_3969 [Burkholderia sp. CF145]|jgi:hypothetical protein|nr:hypothetical protein PMI06_008222 [Burkholderia sp. BT03]SKC73435.1 hypothetical protein SAMN06266956_2525 [Paraburkholderia hospita]SKC88086.1 hypothetical protein SAMN05445504_5265 [Burkholderia sp. CF099]
MCEVMMNRKSFVTGFYATLDALVALFANLAMTA